MISPNKSYKQKLYFLNANFVIQNIVINMCHSSKIL